MQTVNNTLTITGKIIEIGHAEQGETWQRQSFVIRMEDKYIKDIAFNVWNKNIVYLERCRIGDPVNVYFNLESRKYQDKWFTEANAWRIDINLSALRNDNEQNK